MRIALKKSEVSEAVQAVAGIAPQRSTRPILYNMLLKPEQNGRIRLMATDLDVSIGWTVPAAVSGGKDAVLIGARKLADMVREAPEDDIQIEAEGEKATITSGRAHFTLNTVDASEYPSLPDCPKTAVTISLADLAALVDKTSFAVAKDEIRYAINGIYVVAEGKTIELTGTDGHRLANATGKLHKSAADGIAAIAPVKLLNEIPKLYSLLAKTAGAGEGEEENSTPPSVTADISVSESEVFVKVGDVVLSGRQLEGTYPKYKEVIPKELKEKVEINKEKFLAALRRAALVTTEETRSVAIEIRGNVVKVSGRDPEVGTSEEEVDAKFEGEAREVAFDPRYLRDGLAKLKEDAVKLEVEDNERAGVVREPGYIYVLMPIRR